MRDMPVPAIVWFRQDLRLSDNPALHAVQNRPTLAVYVLDDAAAGSWAHGGAQRWWLHRSLAALDAALRERGIALHLARGAALDIIPALAARIGADEVHAGRLYEPWARRRDDALAERLRAKGRRLALHTSTLLHEPTGLQSGAGRPYAQYAPFARAIFARGEPPAPLPAPAALSGPALPGLPLDALELLPRPPIPEWWSGFEPIWTPGEAGAAQRLSRFAETALRGYGEGRNLPGEDRSSGLSPHLRWGEISPRQVWHAVRGAGAVGEDVFLKELLWREFSYHLLWHRPEMPERPLNPLYERFPAEPDPKLLHAWQSGQTGYPIVDAGIRQLWQTGWMHNRVRLIAGSALVKQLLQPWQDGAAWFWDTLVDADLANNSASWQWIAGSGVDASPYFRVFNPTLQGEKFDPEGRYVRRWLPELKQLPDRWLHRPWEAPEPALAKAGLRLDLDYPRPLVTPAAGRARALAAFAAMRAAPAEA